LQKYSTLRRRYGTSSHCAEVWDAKTSHEENEQAQGKSKSKARSNTSELPCEQSGSRQVDDMTKKRENIFQWNGGKR